MQLTRDVTTLADLRAFLAYCDQADMPDDTRLHARVGFGMFTAGPPLRSLTARSSDPAPRTPQPGPHGWTR